MPGGNKCVTFLLPPGIKGLRGHHYCTPPPPHFLLVKPNQLKKTNTLHESKRQHTYSFGEKILLNYPQSHFTPPMMKSTKFLGVSGYAQPNQILMQNIRAASDIKKRAVKFQHHCSPKLEDIHLLLLEIMITESCNLIGQDPFGDLRCV